MIVVVCVEEVYIDADVVDKTDWSSLFDVVLMDISVGGRRLLMVDARLLVLRAELRWLLPEAPLRIISAAKRTPFRLPD